MTAQLVDGRGPSVRVFVSPRGNAFMADVASWLAEAADLVGRPATLIADGRIPTDLDDPECAINLVVAPHEFWWLGDADDRTIQRNAEVSIPVCTEQPGTRWFEMTSLLARPSRVVLDINLDGTDALRADGHDAHHLRLGAVPSMDRRAANPVDASRPVDLLFLGGRTRHRTERLAELAPTLWRYTADLRLFSSAAPVSPGAGGTVFGTDKYDLLARSRILLNLHRDESDSSHAYFEWARMVEAMANGVCVVSEPSTGTDPLIDGTHVIFTADLVETVSGLLNDPDRCERAGSAAADFVLREQPLATTLEPILDRLADAECSVEPRGRRNIVSPGRRVPAYRSLLTRAQQIPLLPALRPHTELRRRVKSALDDEVRLQRRIEATRARLHHGDAGHVTVDATAAGASPGAPIPRISVVVTLFDYADVVAEALASVLASTEADASTPLDRSTYEIVVVDDHSRDQGADVVRRFIDDHPDARITLLSRAANAGLAAARNLGVERSSGEYVMILDADNLVYPPALARLAAALDDDLDASFAYAILEEFGVSTGLQSDLGWHVPWLCSANHIDAQAMIRRSVLDAMGGYRDDLRIFGWEDWDLWLRLADAGHRAVHVTQILGRYRTQGASMISTSNRFQDVMLDHLESTLPGLPWPTRL
ncbi:MAG: glycosyltransferase [Actinomycetota bacterium]